MKKIIKFDQILIYLTNLKNNQLCHSLNIFLSGPIVYNLEKIMYVFDIWKITCEHNIRRFKRRHLIDLVNNIFNFYIYTYYVHKFKNVAWWNFFLRENWEKWVSKLWYNWSSFKVAGYTRIWSNFMIFFY